MLLSTTLCWNIAHVATRRFCNSSVLRIGTRYKRSCNIQTQLYQPHLRWAWSNNQRAVLPRRVADAEAATSNPQHCWRRVCLPARQCTNTSCSWHSWASAPWDSSSVLRYVVTAHILHHFDTTFLQRTWLRMTLGSPSLSIRHLIVEPPRFRFLCLSSQTRYQS